MNDAAINKVRLSQQEVLYLQNTHFLPESLARLVTGSEQLVTGHRVLDVNRAIAEEFRSALTDHLARVGFDENYEPTREGKLIEDLIDRFS